LCRRHIGNDAVNDRGCGPGPAVLFLPGSGTADRAGRVDQPATAQRHHDDPRTARRGVMTIAENQPLPAMPRRPARALPTWRLLRVAQQNSLAACDEELFDELIVERRFLGRKFFVVSDPDGIRRVLQDNCDNYPRLTWIRRMFEFAS